MSQVPLDEIVDRLNFTAIWYIILWEYEDVQKSHDSVMRESKPPTNDCLDKFYDAGSARERK